MSTARLDRQRALRTAQILAGLYSAIFIGTIWFGYYLLFQKDILLALFLATVLALTAWFLARYVGSEPNGIRRFLPLFIMLLIISAVGVFNSLMLNLEGRHIFAETTEGSIDQFTQLEAMAKKTLVQRGITAHDDHVATLESQLTQEINNPLNCGQGPVAAQIISDLKQELPGFQPLSSKKVDCSKNEQVIDTYHSKIAALRQTAAWNNPDLIAVRDGAGDQKNRLQKLAASTQGMFAPALLRVAAPALQNADDSYRGFRDKLSRQDVDVSELRPKLDLDQINSLGEWSQLLNLIIDRLNKVSTYVYLALAGFFDWMMVYLFGLVRLNRGSKGALRAPSGALQGAW